MAAVPKTFARFFSADKTVPSRAMNRVGAQVARTVLARMMHNMRGVKVDPSVRTEVETLERDGMLVIPDFLPRADLDELHRRTEEVWEREQDKVKVLQHGPNTLNVLSEERAPIAADLNKFFGDPRVPAILEAIERRPNTYARRANKVIERLKQSGPLDLEDPETKLHSDIFFTTHKAWLYLTDVTLECGPLVFVKGSHRLSPKLLSYVYSESCRQNAGSRRITKEELNDLGLEETVMVCPRNTLVVANTFGFHRRLRGQPGHERLSLHAGLRTNPFMGR